MLLPRNIVRCLLFASVCSGCALQAAKPPAPELPTAFERASPDDSSDWPGRDWYRNFGSAELDALIAQASAGNFDLGLARSRVMQADLRAKQAHAGILPSVDAAGSDNYLAGHSVNGTAHETDWSALLSASYEVDFWGKNRAAADSARYLAIAARGDRDTVAITTLAAVADGYFQALSLRERLGLARSNVDAARTLMQIVDARYQAGVSNPVEVAAQKAILATAESAIPELEQTEAEALAAVAVLLGRSPEGFRIQGSSLESLEEPGIAAGLPSELLRRRPDIAAAEATFNAASADVVAARAALFPSLSLTAAGGIQNPALNAAINSLSGAGPSLNLGASLTQPIFNGGKLRAARAEAQAKAEESAIEYRAAIVGALVDVENALSSIHHLNQGRDFQFDAVAQSLRAFEGAQLRYQAGHGDFQMTLEAQRNLYTVQDLYCQYKLARLRALVSLSKALGGGWQIPDVVPPARAAGDPLSSRNPSR